jgi:hypothetical protein
VEDSFYYEILKIDSSVSKVIFGSNETSEICVRCNDGEFAVVVSSCGPNGHSAVDVDVYLNAEKVGTVKGSSLSYSDVVFFETYCTRAPTPYECSWNECSLEFELLPDLKPQDVMWTISRVRDSPGVLRSGKNSDSICLSEGYYDFVLSDSGLDGLSDGINGDYHLKLDNEVLRSKGSFRQSEGYFFKCTPKVSASPTLPPTVDTCLSTDLKARIDVKFKNVVDKHQVAWSITNKTGYSLFEVYSGDDGSVCLPCEVLYYFRLNNIHGTGLNGGTFTVSTGPALLLPNVEFNYSYIDIFTPPCGEIANPSTSPTAAPSKAPSPSTAPTVVNCVAPESQVQVRIYSSGDAANHTWRFYSLGDNSVDVLYSEPNLNYTFCASPAVYLIDFVGNSNTAYEVRLNGRLVCDDTVGSAKACVIQASATLNPSANPSAAPSKYPSVSPTTPWSDPGLPPTSSLSCQPNEGKAAFHVNKQTFKWSWISLPEGVTYKGDESTPVSCINMGETNVISFQASYAPFNYHFNFEGVDYQNTSNSKTVTYTLPGLG